MLIGIGRKRLGKKGGKGLWRILIMNTTLHIIKPGRRVLEGRTHRIQKDTHGHPFLIPNPEGLFHQIRIQSQYLLHLFWQILAVKGLKEPLVRVELIPLGGVLSLVNVPQFVDKGLQGQRD